MSTVVVGQVCHELVVAVPASAAWDLYGSLQVSKIAQEANSERIQKVEFLQGKGRVGTTIRVTFHPGRVGLISGHTEKYVKVDDEKRVKEVEIIEGGLLDFGFTSYLIRFEIIDAGDSSGTSCIIRSSIDYKVKEEQANASSLVNIKPLANIAEMAKKQLLSTVKIQ